MTGQTEFKLKSTRIAGDPELCVSAYGEGELVVFLHGIGGNRSNWNRQLLEVGDYAHAVAVDLRGYGDSADYDGDTSITAFAEDIVRIADHFDVVKLHLVGLSLGGRIAQRFAALFPLRLASLVLADTRSDTRDTRSVEDRAAFLRARAEPLLAGRTPADIAPGIVRSLIGPHATDAAIAELTQSAGALRAKNYIKTIKAHLSDDFVASGSSIEVPALVLVGEYDSVTPRPLAEELVAAIPGARLEIVPDAGHVSNIEQPGHFNALLSSFLREQVRTDRGFSVPRTPAAASR